MGNRLVDDSFRFGTPDLASLPTAERKMQAVELLRGGKIDKFNRAVAKARKTNPGFVLDLSGADLAGTHLRGVDLKGSRLNDVDFTGADLPKADLLEADLRGAKLKGTNLIGASLCRPT